MGHVGQELGLVLASDFELAALLFDLAEQPRVLNCQCGLRGEGLQELNGPSRKQPRCVPTYDKAADEVVLAE